MFVHRDWHLYGSEQVGLLKLSELFCFIPNTSCETLTLILCLFNPQQDTSAPSGRRNVERTLLWLCCRGVCLCLRKAEKLLPSSIISSCGENVSRFSSPSLLFPQLSALTAPDLAGLLKCDRSSSSSGSTAAWKLLLSKASLVLDEALDLLTNSVRVILSCAILYKTTRKQ